jgi:hypothetical protein
MLIFFAAVMALACSAKHDTEMQVISLSASAGAEPCLFSTNDGATYLSWIEKHGKKSELKFSKLDGSSWSTPALIDSGSTWFVNWADYPMIAAKGNQLIAHYLDKSADDTFAYDVKITFSFDAGATWSKAAILHDDGKQVEHGFVSLLPYGEHFFVAWLDGRNTAADDSHGEHHGQMSLRAAVVNSNGEKIEEWELDNRTCDCCQTSAALTFNGPVVVYRDRSEDEIRDISIVRFVNGAWTQPKPVHNDNWKISGCPVNGPRVVADADRVVVAWFSMPDDNPQVNVIFSENGGETFGTPVRVDDGHAIGRVDLAMLDDEGVFVIWMEGKKIMGAKVTTRGKQSAVEIAPSSGERSSGFPQVTRAGKQLVFAWTDDKEKVVKTAVIAL